MNLFQSEWLREPPPMVAHRYAAGTHARPAYGVRYARATVAPSCERNPEAADMRPVVVVPSPTRRRPVASFDRAA